MTQHIRPVARIRAARRGDVGTILALIKGLAQYEREPAAVVASEVDLSAALFPSTGSPAAFAHLAELSPGPAVAGFTLWFPTFSTWTGRPGIWLEDLFVLPEHRGLGLGRALLSTLAAECRDRGYPRLDWSVLDWNTRSIGFYRALGAQPLTEWTQYRLTGPDLARLADHGRLDRHGE